jgi:hypothetical protein
MVPNAPGATPVRLVELEGGGGGGGAQTGDEGAGPPAVVCVHAGAIPLAVRRCRCGWCWCGNDTRLTRDSPRTLSAIYCTGHGLNGGCACPESGYHSFLCKSEYLVSRIGRSNDLRRWRDQPHGHRLSALDRHSLGLDRRGPERQGGSDRVDHGCRRRTRHNLCSPRKIT